MKTPSSELQAAHGNEPADGDRTGSASAPGLVCIALVGGLLVAPLLMAQQSAVSTTPKTPSKSSGNFKADAEVLIESQEKALEMAKELTEKSDNPRVQAALTEVVKQMERALKLLETAKDDPKQLEPAVAAQQGSYQALLKLAEREFRVQQGKQSKGGSKSASEESRQRQVNELEMKMTKNRYEQQKQAKAEPQQSPEQTENLQMSSRLRELAQRQNDLNERLKELQTALQEAKAEPEKEEIRRRLKRLREEEQQMLADLDELKQRAEKPENQQRMQDLKDKLDQTRQDAQKAAEQMDKGNVSQALASGTRAQRELQQMREDLRKKNANQFAEDMKQLRQEARDVAQKQEELGKQMDAAQPQQAKRKSLSEPDAKSEVPKELAEQNQRLASLVDRATQIAEQSESAEPLLHRQLYDSIRKQAQAEAQNLKATKDELARRGMMTRGLYDMLEKASNDGGTKSLQIASELAKNGMNLPASSVEQRARKGIEELKKGVERAAESVLGDEGEALKQAARTLDSLARQLESELARAEAKNQQGGESQAGQQPGEPKGKQGQQPQGDGKAPGKQASKQGEGDQPGEKGGKQGSKAGQEGKQGEPKEGSKSGQGGKQGEAKAGTEPGEGEQPGEKGGKQGSKAGQESKQGEPKEGSKSGQGGKQGEGKEGAKSGEGGQQPGGKEGQKGGQPSQEQGEQPGQQAGKGGGRGQAQDANSPQRNRTTGQASTSNRGSTDGSHTGEYQGGNNRGGNWDNILNNRNAADRFENLGPITGGGFDQFSDRLRDAEEMVDSAELRNQLQTVRERVRTERLEFKRQAAEPKWDLVRMQILKPLVEVRQRIEEELAKRDNREAMVPIDRDPVPSRFSELVRKYYENLGKSDSK